MSLRFALVATLLAACPSPRTPPPVEARAPIAQTQTVTPRAAAPQVALTFVDPATSSRHVTVTAKLVRVRDTNPHCGGVHFGSLMEYELISVEAGTLAQGNGLLVGVGCPDIARDRYDTNAGTLDAFRVGERHRLTLSNDRADGRGMAVIETEPLFYAIAADPV